MASRCQIQGKEFGSKSIILGLVSQTLEGTRTHLVQTTTHQVLSRCCFLSWSSRFRLSTSTFSSMFWKAHRHESALPAADPLPWNQVPTWTCLSPPLVISTQPSSWPLTQLWIQMVSNLANDHRTVGLRTSLGLLNHPPHLSLTAPGAEHCPSLFAL